MTSHRHILLHEHSKVFKIIYTNCPGNVLSGKVIVRETSATLHACNRLNGEYERSHRGAVWVGRSSTLPRRAAARRYDLVGVDDVEQVVPGVRRRGAAARVEPGDGAARDGDAEAQ